MYASALRSEPVAPAAPQRQRALGRIALTVVRRGPVTRALRVAEAGSLRLRLPRAGATLEAVLINTAGGVACGDRFAIEVDASAEAQVALTTPAA
ncbi:MAG TPA: urease accessory protein UreD, partial [Beijerinckiaceae bacterium]|nr:urease accessory protein UreD [Beijerinckiaceae bacterium]